MPLTHTLSNVSESNNNVLGESSWKKLMMWTVNVQDNYKVIAAGMCRNIFNEMAD